MRECLIRMFVDGQSVRGGYVADATGEQQGWAAAIEGEDGGGRMRTNIGSFSARWRRPESTEGRERRTSLVHEAGGGMANGRTLWLLREHSQLAQAPLQWPVIPERRRDEESARTSGSAHARRAAAMRVLGGAQSGEGVKPRSRAGALYSGGGTVAWW